MRFWRTIRLFMTSTIVMTALTGITQALREVERATRIGGIPRQFGSEHAGIVEVLLARGASAAGTVRMAGYRQSRQQAQGRRGFHRGILVQHAVNLDGGDGRATAVLGTHTHVPTADERVLPGGTAYMSDVGMTGPRGGVIGVKREQAIESLRTHMKIRYETAEEDPWLMMQTPSTPRRSDQPGPVVTALCERAR